MIINGNLYIINYFQLTIQTEKILIFNHNDVKDVIAGIERVAHTQRHTCVLRQFRHILA